MAWYTLTMYFFYLFLCLDGSLYAGITNNLLRREALHNSGKGSAYTRSRGGGRVVYFEKFPTKSHALKREVEVKKWKREKKLLLLGSKSLQKSGHTYPSAKARNKRKLQKFF